MSSSAHRQTPSQTVGPYFTMSLSGEGENVLTTPETVGQRIRVEGRVFDGDRRHIEDALVELWQADGAGRYHHPADDRTDAPLDPAFTGFGRCASDFQTGAYSFLTIKPGSCRIRTVECSPASQPHDPGAWNAQPNLHPRVSSPTSTRPMPPTRCCNPCPIPVGPTTYRGARRGHRVVGAHVPLRHPLSGRRRNRLLRCLNDERLSRVLDRSDGRHLRPTVAGGGDDRGGSGGCCRGRCCGRHPCRRGHGDRRRMRRAGRRRHPGAGWIVGTPVLPLLDVLRRAFRRPPEPSCTVA